MGFVEPTKFSWVTDAKSGTRTKKAARGSKWKARYTDPAGRDRRRTFERKMDAEKFLERIGTEMQTSEWIDPKTTKSRFDDWVEVWWKTTVKLAPSTRRGYEKMLRLYLRPKFDGRKINAGLRASELCGLRVMDIDWQGNTLTVNEVQMWVKGELVVKGPKTASGVRTIPLPAWLIADISAVMNVRAASAGIAFLTTDRLFTSPTGKPMLDHTIWRIVNRAQESAGLPRFRPYDLRHSHASLLINLGAHPKAISERMGHTEIGVTMNVYGHLFEGAQGQLTQDLDDLLERSRAEVSSDPEPDESEGR